MNFNMKNRIWKNLSAMSMAFFMTGMVLGGCGQTTVYAAELGGGGLGVVLGCGGGGRGGGG